MELSHEDLLAYGTGHYSKIQAWSTKDFDPDRVKIPSYPYMFLSRVTDIEPPHIRYLCTAKNNPLFEGLSYIPRGVLIEFFQGYLILADFMEFGKPDLTARILGGEIHYHLEDIPINCPIHVEVTFEPKPLFLKKSRVVTYNAKLYADQTLAVELRNFKGIFYDPTTTPKTSSVYEGLIQEAEKEEKFILERPEQLKTFNKMIFKDQKIQAHYNINKDSWFFGLHFWGDPCMPGSFVLQGFLDILESNHIKINGPLIAKAKRSVTPDDKELIYFMDFEASKAFGLVDQQIAFELDFNHAA